MESNIPISTIQAAAIQVHELYISYVNAGFTEEQALELIKTHIMVTPKDLDDTTSR